jgi:hypothetical protein
VQWQRVGGLTLMLVLKKENKQTNHSSFWLVFFKGIGDPF